MLSDESYVFDLTRQDYKYKGILFADVDHIEICKEMNSDFGIPENFVAKIVGIIWVDEKGIWHFKFRIKFPLGDKQVWYKIYDEEDKKGININETFILQESYEFPMINNKWLSNPDETPLGIINLIKESNKIDYL